MHCIFSATKLTNDIISFPINTSSKFPTQELGCDAGDCHGKISLGEASQAGPILNVKTGPPRPNKDKQKLPDWTTFNDPKSTKTGPISWHSIYL